MKVPRTKQRTVSDGVYNVKSLSFATNEDGRVLVPNSIHVRKDKISPIYISVAVLALKFVLDVHMAWVCESPEGLG